MLIATLHNSVNHARWGLVLLIMAATATVVATVRHALMRTTQIVALFHEDVKRDGDGGPKLRVVGGDDDH